MEMTLNIPDAEAKRIFKSIFEEGEKQNLKMEALNVHLDEVDYLVKLHQENGAGFNCRDRQEVINVMLHHLTEGTRNPDSWEREFVEKMGLLSCSPVHDENRHHYGADENNLLVI